MHPSRGLRTLFRQRLSKMDTTWLNSKCRWCSSRHSSRTKKEGKRRIYLTITRKSHRFGSLAEVWASLDSPTTCANPHLPLTNFSNHPQNKARLCKKCKPSLSIGTTRLCRQVTFNKTTTIWLTKSSTLLAEMEMGRLIFLRNQANLPTQKDSIRLRVEKGPKWQLIGA